MDAKVNRERGKKVQKIRPVCRDDEEKGDGIS
jgi:hypothetical protein